MPTIEMSFSDLERLVGASIPKDAEELDYLLSFIKAEVEEFTGDYLRVEVKDGNRPDLWTVEGIARALRGVLSVETGLREFKLSDQPPIEVFVDPALKEIRPYIACAVVYGVEIDESVLVGFIRLQDKLDLTYGRGRKRTSIGLYVADLITPPIYYKLVGPDEVSFVPLGFDEELTLRRILEEHPKGIEYGHIIKDYPKWPILMDSRGKVLSMPPIINSADLGRVTTETRNILVEVTGTNWTAVSNTLTIVATSIAERGGVIRKAVNKHPYEPREIETPQLQPNESKVTKEYVKSVVGLDLEPAQIAELLEKARYGAKAVGDEIVVQIPAYRVDIMHPVDIVEDVAIMYGYDRIEPVVPQIMTIGDISEEEKFANLVREIMIGFGFQEILTFIMSSPEIIRDKMRLPREGYIEVANPRTLRFTCLRDWITPSLIEFLSFNTHVEYPQKVFEVGYCVVPVKDSPTGARDKRVLGFAIAGDQVTFTDAKSIADGFLRLLGLSYELREIDYPSFIEGRVGKIVVGGVEAGMIGEVHPEVLNNFGIGKPVVVCEIDLGALQEVKKRGI